MTSPCRIASASPATVEDRLANPAALACLEEGHVSRIWNGDAVEHMTKNLSTAFGAGVGNSSSRQAHRAFSGSPYCLRTVSRIGSRLAPTKKRLTAQLLSVKRQRLSPPPLKNDDRHSHKPTGPSQRMLRVGELVRHALAQLFVLRRDRGRGPHRQADHRARSAHVAFDLKLASAYIMPLGGERAVEIVEALNRHARFIRGRIAPEIDLKFSPEFRFFIDETFEQYGKIDALLKSDRVQRDLHPEEPDDDKDSD